ncbi:thiolase family protein [Luteithermobacter gelatinilyticus]|uniref:thiolase family protein n=1 Tax=Luteithermobacter gelatinilyticus TaxID=2582913 RepID=UPI001105EA55|nr:thiolase family protein [Luteithermobacter gelatinilyticus]|tara:strand:+ start:17452 stop:18633 length:1182 start_codon:yes stop_codon:yes gene_type:complete
MSKASGGYEGVALTAPVTLPYVKSSPYGAPWFIGSALRELLKTSGLKKDQIDGLATSSFTLRPDSTITLTEYLRLSPRWIADLPYGGASGVIALQRAARAVQAGDADIIACIGGDTANAESFKKLVHDFSSFSNSSAYWYGAGGPNMAFAQITQHYMDRFGATREDFARIALSQRHNANHFDLSLFRNKPMTREDYLSARPIAGPVHLLDCVMPCAGAEAFLVMSTERAHHLGLAYAEILSTGELHNSFPDDPIQIRGGWAAYADEMYHKAGLGPRDMDMLQTYDDYPVISLMQMEDLGFCEKGQGPAFLRETNLNFDGDGLPHNTCGGQLSCGQAGSAAGYMGVVESLRQLTGQALGNPVKKAETALISGYGMINYNRGLCSAAAILRKGGQ